MDAILHLPPGLPPHDPAAMDMAPFQVVTTWPEGTFLENLAFLPDGSLAVSVLSEARLDRVAPDGTITVLHQFAAPPTGLAVMDVALYVAVGEPGAGTPNLWRIDPSTGYGELWMPLDGMVFANGVTPFALGELLIADSWNGQLWRVDIGKKTLSLWFEHEFLTRAPGMDFLPGANGVKRWGDEVTVSSNGRALLLRIMVADNGAAGSFETLSERLRADDFAYDVHGCLYLTTHIGASLDRLERDGSRMSVGGAEQGFAGSTAAAFGPDGRLYVTTTGGIVGPPDGILQPARLIRVETGSAGHPLDRAWEKQA